MASNEEQGHPRVAVWWQSVCVLRHDGRRSLTALSRDTGVPVSTLYDRLRTWPVLRRSTILLDFARLGGVHAWVLVSAVPHGQMDAVEAFLARHAAVNTVQRVLTDADFLVEVVLPDLHAVEDFVNTLHIEWRIGAVRLLYVVRDVAREAYLTDPLRYPALTGAPALEALPVSVTALPVGELSALDEVRLRVT